MLRNVKNVYAFRDSQNSATSYKIVLNGSLLLFFDHHINSAMYESKKYVPLRFWLPHLAEFHILSTFCAWALKLGSTKLYQ
jgi:hypothetical protein